MHMDAVREIVLAERDGKAPRADRLSELQHEGILLGHAGRLGRRYFPLYYCIDRLPISFILRKQYPFQEGDIQAIKPSLAISRRAQRMPNSDQRSLGMSIFGIRSDVQ